MTYTYNVVTWFLINSVNDDPIFSVDEFWCKLKYRTDRQTDIDTHTHTYTIILRREDRKWQFTKLANPIFIHLINCQYLRRLHCKSIWYSYFRLIFFFFCHLDAKWIFVCACIGTLVVCGNINIFIAYMIFASILRTWKNVIINEW